MQYYLHEVSPFGYPRIKACEAAPRGFSQPSTSFVGVLRQGILCVRLTNFLRLRALHASAESPTKPYLKSAAGGALLAQHHSPLTRCINTTCFATYGFACIASVCKSRCVIVHLTSCWSKITNCCLSFACPHNFGEKLFWALTSVRLA
jgi:hypothetical protein